MDHTYLRGDIFYANLAPVIGSEQDGNRPVLIVQNDVGNLHSPTVIIAPITTKRPRLPTHVPISVLKYPSIVLLEQFRAIDKRRLTNRIARLDEETMKQVDAKAMVSMGLSPVGT